ncbi:MAG: PEP-CTERM sorting domain-containing protein [Phycisphaerae bacterium]|nr:PEP-CTERM sorting domain-containing protein [Phycisphaerae bacterium]
MKNALGIAVMCVTLSAVASTGLAIPFEDVVVDAWAYASGGADDNTAMCVVDFGGGNSYAFGYKWEDGDLFTRQPGPFATLFGATVSAGNSEAMLMALDAQTPLQVTSEVHPQFGRMIKGLAYDGHQIIEADGAWAAFWWRGYMQWERDLYDANWNWIGTETVPAQDGTGDDSAWVSAEQGVAHRMLDDGLWDGWTQGAGPWGTVLDKPVTPVPEPMTMTLLALGGFGLLRKRRRRA